MAPFNADTTAYEVIKNFANEACGKTSIHFYLFSARRIANVIPQVVITGTSKGGIGAETAISLASARPKQIILASRNEAKVTPVIDEIMKANSTVGVTFVEMTLADNSLDKLINNAGIMGVETFSTSKMELRPNLPRIMSVISC
ncbi:hypothetical protein N7G274_010445 [Stereocaulon virgatum]|uniref:Uncharacterized protein n=1 Tax=Stereocaulon virgatum TaxID=373712 RepID=A0ABR3ZXN1_9LECA